MDKGVTRDVLEAAAGAEEVELADAVELSIAELEVAGGAAKGDTNGADGAFALRSFLAEDSSVCTTALTRMTVCPFSTEYDLSDRGSLSTCPR